MGRRFSFELMMARALPDLEVLPVREGRGCVAEQEPIRTDVFLRDNIP